MISGRPVNSELSCVSRVNLEVDVMSAVGFVEGLGVFSHAPT